MANTNFDVGEPTSAGRYKGADQAYDELLGRLADHKFDKVSPELKAHLLAYYDERKGPGPASPGKVAAGWRRLVYRLELLRSASAASSSGGSP